MAREVVYEFSFGQLLKNLKFNENVKFEKRRDLIISYCCVFVVGNILTYLYYKYMYYNLKADIDKIDELSNTPSDFCVIGYCYDFSKKCDYSIKGIEQEIREYFRFRFEIPDIEYVNVVYKINNSGLLKLYTKERLLKRKIEFVRWY